MSKRDKLLVAMWRNPRNDWSIEDVQRLCSSYEVSCNPPSGGSHWKVSHPMMEEILTVPAHRPIKAIYIKKLVDFIESVNVAMRDITVEVIEQEQPA